MKKIILIFLVLLNLLCTMQVFAKENGIVLKIADVYEKSASTVRVPVMVEKNTAFASFKMEVTYDNSMLKPKSVSKNALLFGGLEYNLNSSSDTMEFVYASHADIKATGILFYITFEVLVNYDFKSYLSLDVDFLSDADFSSPAFQCENGSVEMRKNLFPLDSVVEEITYRPGTCMVSAVWTNKTNRYLFNTQLYVTAYDAKGRVLENLQSYYDFQPYESLSLSQLLNDDGAVRYVKIMAWSENLQPLSQVVSATFKTQFPIQIDTFEKISQATNLQYTLCLNATAEEEAVVYVVAYDVYGNMLIVSEQIVTLSAGENTLEGVLECKEAAKVKCFVWDVDTLAPKAESKEFSVASDDTFDISLASAKATVSGEQVMYEFAVNNTCQTQKVLQCYIVSYDKTGKMLECQPRILVTSDENSLLMGAFSKKNVAKLKLMIWDNDSLQPYAKCEEITVR